MLSYVDGTLHDRAGEIVIGRSPAGVALSPDGKLAFAANRESDTVSIVTTNDWTVAATVPVGRAPFALAVSPDGSRVYVANVQGGTLSVIDVKRRETTATIKVGAMPYGVAPTADGSKILVANQQSGTVSVDRQKARAGRRHRQGRPLPGGHRGPPRREQGLRRELVLGLRLRHRHCERP